MIIYAGFQGVPELQEKAVLGTVLVTSRLIFHIGTESALDRIMLGFPTCSPEHTLGFPWYLKSE